MNTFSQFSTTLESLLTAFRFRFGDEKELQDSLDALFQTSFLGGYHREYRLSPRDVVDFYFEEPRIGLEVKIGGSLADVTRQLGRYAAHEQIAGLILVTTLKRHDRLPGRFLGQPLQIIVLPGGLA
jgi:hypothetical protein